MFVAELVQCFLKKKKKKGLFSETAFDKDIQANDSQALLNYEISQ